MKATMRAERDQLRAQLAEHEGYPGIAHDLETARAQLAELASALDHAVCWMIANPSERESEETARIATLERCGKAQRAVIVEVRP